MRKAKVAVINSYSISTHSKRTVFVIAAAVVSVLIVGIVCAKANGGVMLLSSTVAEQAGQWEVVQMRVTAYCPCPKCCGEYSDGITACNHKIEAGDAFVAADGRYSFGTVMLIPGYNGSEAVKVLDRGGAIQGDRLDVFFHTHEAALDWGVRYLDVKVRI